MDETPTAQITLKSLRTQLHFPPIIGLTRSGPIPSEPEDRNQLRKVDGWPGDRQFPTPKHAQKSQPGKLGLATRTNGVRFVCGKV